MTTNMNFGPEWMRPSVSKRSNTFDFPNGSTYHPNLNGDSGFISDHQTRNSIPGQMSEGLVPSNNVDNPYKYSKEFMLSLYKPVDPPADFERHDYVSVEESQGPLSFVDLSETEKKLLAGPVHSEVGRRMMGGGGSGNNERSNGLRNNTQRDMYASPLQSPAFENTPNTSGRLNVSRSKGRMHDYFPRDRDQHPKRYENDGPRHREWSQSDSPSALTPNKSRDDEQEEVPTWGSVSQDAVGSFDSNGMFQAGAGGSGIDPRRGWQGDVDVNKGTKPKGFHYQGDESFGSPLKGLSDRPVNGTGTFHAEDDGSAGAPFFGAKKPASQYKWFYRDPQGTVQGPFEATEMQEWFKAGFFAPSLLIRREDEAQFEPLMMMIRRVGNDEEPFLTNLPAHPTDSPGALNMALGSRSRVLDPFARSTVPSGSMMGLDSAGSVGAGFFGNTSQPPDLLSPQGAGLDFGNKFTPLGGLSSLSTNFLQQQIGQGPSSPHSPSILQGPMNSFGPSLLGSRDGASPWGEKTRTPSWLNNGQSDFFGGSGSTADLAGVPPLFRQHQQQSQQAQQPQQQHGLNPLFSSNTGSPGLFEYQRALNEQQYLHLLQQKQQQQLQQQFQQQLSQQQSLDAMMPPQQQQQQQQQLLSQHQPSVLQQMPPVTQAAFPQSNLNLENPIHKQQTAPNSAVRWDSAPGTPIGGENRSLGNSWLKSEPVSTSHTVPVTTEATIPEPGPKAQAHEPETDDFVEAMLNLDIKREEQVYEEEPEEFSPPPSTTSLSSSTAGEPENVSTTSSNLPAAKPISLREIQAEELRKQQEAKEKQQKALQKQLQQQQQQQAKAQNGSAGKAGWGSGASTPWGGIEQASKGLSLREIQELEAKEAESRKQTDAANSNQTWNTLVNSNKAPTIVSSSNSSSSLPWGATAAPKKTLREIQQEEEEALKRKARQQAALAATAAAATSISTPSKGYANIAGSVTPKTVAVSANAGGAWTTVTSQRAATPKPAPVPASVSQATASATRQQNGWETVGSVKIVPAQSILAPVSRPASAAAAVSRSASKNESGQKPPSEDFTRWCRQSLRGLNAGVNADEILQMLLSFPVDNNSAEIIQDIIYANSTSMDGRRFAAEFMKRRKADMAGKLNVSMSMVSSPAMDEESTFKVVTKKGKKKVQAF